MFPVPELLILPKDLRLFLLSTATQDTSVSLRSTRISMVPALLLPPLREPSPPMSSRLVPLAKTSIILPPSVLESRQLSRTRVHGLMHTPDPSDICLLVQTRTSSSRLALAIPMAMLPTMSKFITGTTEFFRRTITLVVVLVPLPTTSLELSPMLSRLFPYLTPPPTILESSTLSGLTAPHPQESSSALPTLLASMLPLASSPPMV
mmetsp:Transcript_139370/g.338599  ORF Transcript_139370/g.338599 Transcript_139370/m.338599 type:complete len:206 (+) Transcript_139370:466-1083(+)